MVLLSTRTDTCLMLPELSCFICMYPNIFGMMQSLPHAISSTGCRPLSLMEPFLTPSCFLPLQFSFLPPRVFGCVCYIHNLGPGFANLIIVLPSVFLGYSLTHMGYRCYCQSYSSILQVFMLLLLSFSHISLEPVLQMTMSSSCPHHLLSLFRLRVLYLPPLFLYLPPCLCLCRLQLRYMCILDGYGLHLWCLPSSSQPRDLASSTDSDSPPIALRKGTCSCVAKHPIGNFVSY
jgi:hypothetical protein